MIVLKGSMQLNKENTQLEISELIKTMNTLIQFLYANSPRLDDKNRMVVSGIEGTQPISGTVTATVGNATVSNITAISGQPNQYIGQDVPGYIYDNIKVT